jgi:STE24 endopeptidase
VFESNENIPDVENDGGQENHNDFSYNEPVLVIDFDPERRKLALSYTRVSRRYSFGFQVLSFTISLAILISRITIFLKEFIVINITNDPFIVVGIFFIGGFLIVDIWELPIAFYLHSKLSRRYGLSKLTNKKWLFRYVKASAVGFIIGFPLFEGFYWLLRSFPETWWMWGTIVLIMITLILGNLVPILVLPLFYKFEPLEEKYPDLARELIQMTQNEGVKTTSAFTWKIGEIATVGNAALLGLGNTRRIIIADTMLENYTPNEIKWILAHELGHYKHHDLWKGIILGSLSTFLMFLLTHIVFASLSTFLGYSTVIGDIENIPVLGLSFWIISFVLINVPSLWYSRRVEKFTDSFATSIIPDFPVIKSLFIKMTDQNLADINPPWWEKLLFMSHPPIKERIQNARDLLIISEEMKLAQ